MSTHLRCSADFALPLSLLSWLAGVPVADVYILVSEENYFRVTGGSNPELTYLGDATYDTAVTFANRADAEAAYETINEDSTLWAQQVWLDDEPWSLSLCLSGISTDPSLLADLHNRDNIDQPDLHRDHRRSYTGPPSFPSTPPAASLSSREVACRFHGHIDLLSRLCRVHHCKTS